MPVFKNDGERSDRGKYRPISLLPIISKNFEYFINGSLTKHLDITGIFFSDLQYGFRAFRPTSDILTVLSEGNYNSVDAGGETRVLHLISQRHSIRFGMPDCFTILKLMVLLAQSSESWNLFCINLH